MSHSTDSTDSVIRRALRSAKRTWAEMERVHRAMLETAPQPRRR